ncbi:MAG: hypothetical protein C5S48_04585 [Candidatus Methanogaster sp.]|nr:MAG: hypothetical protein C5S48_04585 [ANME-2 cluster archaeon]
MKSQNNLLVSILTRIRSHFLAHNTIAIAEYYCYRRILQKHGDEGLRDEEKDGNYTKLTERIKDYIIAIVEENRSILSPQLQSKILNQFDVHISLSGLNTMNISDPDRHSTMFCLS